MDNKKLILEPKSQPSWKDGLLIVLLIFLVMKSDNTILNIFAIIAASVLAINFAITSFVLFRFNLFSFGTKLIIDGNGENGILENAKNRKEEFREMDYNKIPFNNLYLVRFKTSNKLRTLILNEQELLLAQSYSAK